jgi:AICAR transformylase/IMP cyclohydrolase PurH
MTRAELEAFEANLSQPQQPLTEEDRREWSARLRDVTLVSDGLFPFRDSIDQAARHGVAYVAQPGGAVRDPEIEAACREHGMTMVHTGLRLFHH